MQVGFDPTQDIFAWGETQKEKCIRVVGEENTAKIFFFFKWRKEIMYEKRKRIYDRKQKYWRGYTNEFFQDCKDDLKLFFLLLK